METSANLKTTPLIDEHKRLGAKLAPFGGWLMPIQYSGIISEHLWTRSEVSLFDICHMGEFSIHGNAINSGLDRIVTINLAAMPEGRCHYGFILNESGGILDDLIVYRIGREDWFIVVNAATKDCDAAHFKRHLKPGTDFKDLSQTTGKLDLQGPKSLEVLKRIAGDAVAGLEYYRFGKFDLLGEKVIISRTGYTGELGYEIYISSGKVKDLWKLLLKEENVKPAGLGARDTLRLEMCYPLYGQDLTDQTTPLEAGMKNFVCFDKDFIGKPALEGGKEGAKRLISFASSTRRAPRHNYRIVKEGRDIGVVTSGSFSPSLSCGIGMGYVSEPCAIGAALALKDSAVEISATVTAKPFYKKGTAKLSEVKR